MIARQNSARCWCLLTCGRGRGAYRSRRVNHVIGGSSAAKGSLPPDHDDADLPPTLWRRGNLRRTACSAGREPIECP